MIISRRLKNHFETCEDFQWDIQNGTRTGIPPIFRTIFFFFFLLKEVRYYVGYLVSLFSSRYNLFALMTIRRRRDSKVNRPAREISAPEADYLFSIHRLSLSTSPSRNRLRHLLLLIFPSDIHIHRFNNSRERENLTWRNAQERKVPLILNAWEPTWTTTMRTSVRRACIGRVHGTHRNVVVLK